MIDSDTVTRNADLFTLPPAAVAARDVLAQLEQLQEDVGGAPEPLPPESLGHQLYNRTVRSGLVPTAAELADLCDDSSAQTSRRAADAMAAAVHDAREAFERAVKAGAADYLEQLRGAWAALLAEVKEAGDLPASPEDAVRRNDVEGYQRLQSLVQRADRVRGLHRQLIGQGRVELNLGAFMDTMALPSAGEIPKVHRGVVQPAGPETPAARLKWLAGQEPYLAPDVKTAERALMQWHASHTQIRLDNSGRAIEVSR